MFKKGLISSLMVLMVITLSLPAIAQQGKSDTKPEYVKKDYKWVNIHYEMMKESDYPYKEIDNDLMALFAPAKKEKYENDEFEYRSKKQEFIEGLKKKVEDYPGRIIYTIYIPFEFGEYNFDNKIFPLDPFSSNSYIPIRFDSDQITTSGIPSASGGGDYIPYTYKTFFVNPKFIPDIPMKQSKAKKFVDKRKDQYGNVNRKVFAELGVVIKGFKDSEDFKNHLSGEIVSARIWNSQKENKLLAERIKEDFKEYY